LKRILQAKGTYVNEVFRNKVRALFRIRKIEELISIAELKALYDSGEGWLVNKSENLKKCHNRQKALPEA